MGIVCSTDKNKKKKQINKDKFTDENENKDNNKDKEKENKNEIEKEKEMEKEKGTEKEKGINEEKDKENEKYKSNKDKNYKKAEEFENKNYIQKNKSNLKLKNLDKFIFFSKIDLEEEYFIVSNFENLKCYSLIKKFYSKWEEILLFTRHQKKFSYRNLNKNPDFSILPKEKNINNTNFNNKNELKRGESNENNINNLNNNETDKSKSIGRGSMISNFIGENEEISDLVEKFQISFSFNKYRYIKYLSKGPPNNLRWIIWISLALCQSENDFISKDEYSILTNKTDLNFIRYEEEQIKKDLNRSNPYSSYLKKQKNLDSLYNILKALAIEDPELGYCQGMNILAANFLLISDGNEYEAFNLLRFLFKHLELREFFLNGFPKLIMYIFILNEFIKDNMPKLFAKIIELDIPEETWIFKWLQTLYNLTLPLSITIRLLDCIICFGLEFLLNFSLAFIKFFEKKLLECEDINDFLNIFNIYDLINPDILLPNENKNNINYYDNNNYKDSPTINLNNINPNNLNEKDAFIKSNKLNNKNENVEKNTYFNNKNVNIFLEKEKEKDLNKSNSNFLNNKIYLINKKEELIDFREKLIKNAKKIDLKDSIRNIIENYNKENLDIQNKFKENESSTGDGLHEEKDLIGYQQIEKENINKINNIDKDIINNENFCFSINYNNKDNEIDFNKFNKLSIKEKNIKTNYNNNNDDNDIYNYNNNENTNKYQDTQVNDFLRNKDKNNNNKIVNKTNNIFINLKKYSKTSKSQRFKDFNLKEDEIFFLRRKSLDEISESKRGNYFLKSSKEFYDKERENYNFIKEIEIGKVKKKEKGNDYDNKDNKDLFNINTMNKNEELSNKIFPNSPYKEEGIDSYSKIHKNQNKNNLKLSFLNSIETQININQEIFTCKNFKKNSPDVDSFAFNKNLNTNKHISKMSFFNNNFKNFFTKNFELKKNENNLHLNEVKNYSKVHDTINKIKNKLEIINNIDYYDKKENEEFEENLEQYDFEKRSKIDRNINESGINLAKKSFFLSPPTFIKKQKQENIQISGDKDTNRDIYGYIYKDRDRYKEEDGDEIEMDNSEFEKEIESLYLENYDEDEDDDEEVDDENYINLNNSSKLNKQRKESNNNIMKNSFNENKNIKNINDNMNNHEDYNLNDFVKRKSFIFKRKEDFNIRISPVRINKIKENKSNKIEINDNNKNNKNDKDNNCINKKFKFYDNKYKNQNKNQNENEEENDDLNFSHLNYNLKYSEILKDSGIQNKKSSKNLIKIQLNNISITHNHKRSVIKKYNKEKDKEKNRSKSKIKFYD
jgi:hypothetical protein